MNSKHKTLSIVNLIGTVAVIAWNYMANAMGIKGNTVASLSNEYANLFTPAPYAFSIWGVIFLGLLAISIFMVKRAFDNKADDNFIGQIGPWLIIANILNGAWLYVWLTENTGLSVVVMVLLLISLCVLIVRLNMERWDAPLSIIAFVWWPICAYSGWIAVATIANIAAYLAKIGFGQGSEQLWTLVMIAVAVVLNVYMIFTHNMREFATVGVWALVAIAVRHWDTQPTLQWVSLSAAIILFLLTAYHGYKNRASNPFAKSATG